MKGEVYIATLKLKGEIFKINRRIDKATDLNHYVELQKVLYRKQVQRDQYIEALNEFEKQEQLKRINKMRKRIA